MTAVRTLAVGLVWTMAANAAAADSAIDRTFDRMYRLDFPGALALVGSHIEKNPDDPLGHTVQAAAHLFRELNRLQILESEFFKDDSRIVDKRQLKPDAGTRDALFQSLDAGRRLARGRLDAKASDANALFSLCMAAGVQTDYMALIEKRQLSSLTHAKESHGWAVKLLQIDPSFHDAYLTTGVSEYLLGSMPFFVRWFVRFDQTEGSKTAAVRNLQTVAQSGRYLRPFAKVLLAVIHLREKRPGDAGQLLEELAREYPENPLFRRELEKLARRR